ARVWCGARKRCGLRLGNGTRDMNEPTPARVIGSEVAWTGWRPATEQAAAPRPDAVRPEMAVGRGTISGTTGSDEAKRAAPGVAATPAAVFPTSYARFAIDAETQRLSIKIVDLVTDEVIREIPSEQVQRI